MNKFNIIAFVFMSLFTSGVQAQSNTSYTGENISPEIEQVRISP